LEKPIPTNLATKKPSELSKQDVYDRVDYILSQGEERHKDLLKSSVHIIAWNVWDANEQNKRREKAERE